MVIAFSSSASASLISEEMVSGTGRYTRPPFGAGSSEIRIIAFLAVCWSKGRTENLSPSSGHQESEVFD